MMDEVKLFVHVEELSADEVEELGHDSSGRFEAGPLVRVTFRDPGGALVREQIAVLAECRVQPDHTQEV